MVVVVVVVVVAVVAVVVVIDGTAMTTVNALNPRVDITARVFEDFYGESLQVPASEYDVINSFFRRAMTSTEAADNFTVQVFRIAAISETPAQTILAQLRDQDEIQLTATLSYLLNGLRSPSTLLGINEISTPNVWAARNVRP